MVGYTTELRSRAIFGTEWLILQQKETKRLEACVVTQRSGIIDAKRRRTPNDKIMSNRKVCMRSEGRKGEVLTGYRDSPDACTAGSGAL